MNLETSHPPEDLCHLIEAYQYAQARSTPAAACLIDPVTKDHLGNFPQALTHATVVQAALAIQDADIRSRSQSWREPLGS
jgi:hypothetical protein